MLAPLLLLALMHRPCPITIGIAPKGTFFTDRFHGWYKTSLKTLELDLRAGCYNDDDPRPISSVKVAIAPRAPKTRVELVFSVLAGDGWPRAKVNVQSWSHYPKRPPSD